MSGFAFLMLQPASSVTHAGAGVPVGHWWARAARMLLSQPSACTCTAQAGGRGGEMENHGLTVPMYSWAHSLVVRRLHISALGLVPSRVAAFMLSWCFPTCERDYFGPIV